MRHGKTVNHLGRTASHRKAMLSNLASSLILHKRVMTTVAKAKELRKYVEPLLTKAKNDTTHSRRTVFAYLQNKESVKTLFGEVAEKISTRPGGYTRIIKTGNRLGDNAEMCMIELVDYNELYFSKEKTDAKSTKKSTRRAGKKAKADGVAETEEVKSELKTSKVKASAVENLEQSAATVEQQGETETPATPEASEVESAQAPNTEEETSTESESQETDSQEEDKQ